MIHGLLVAAAKDVADLRSIRDRDHPYGGAVTFKVLGLSPAAGARRLAGEEGNEPSLTRFWRPPLCR